MKLAFKTYFFLLAFSSLHAQYSEYTKVGLEESFNYFEMSGDYNITREHQSRFGYYLGLVIDIHVKGNTSFITGLNWIKSNTQSGSNLYDVNTQSVIFVQHKNTFHYLGVPLIAQYTFDNNIFVNGGAFVNYLSRYQTNVNNIGLPAHNIKRGRLDIGVSAGFGYNFIHTRYTNLYIAFRNNLGLKNTGNLDFNINTMNLITGWKVTI